MKKILIAGYEHGYDNYVKALNDCGADAAVTLAPDSLDDYGGLLLPGGGDINPGLYGQKNCGSRSIDDGLDQAQLWLLSRFAAKNKPVLGICRGIQLINVYFGGTLIQHLTKTAVHQQPQGDVFHPTILTPGSMLQKLYGTCRIMTNSNHHQAVLRPGRGLIPVAFSSDQVTEAVIHQSLPVLGIQWHPERMRCTYKGCTNCPDGSGYVPENYAEGSRIFRHFIKAADGGIDIHFDRNYT